MRRLNEIIQPLEPLPLEQVVYFNHLCADCHFRGCTRFYEESYLCDVCIERRLTETPEPAPAAERRPWRRRREDGNDHRPVTA